MGARPRFFFVTAGPVISLVLAACPSPPVEVEPGSTSSGEASSTSGMLVSGTGTSGTDGTAAETSPLDASATDATSSDATSSDATSSDATSSDATSSDATSSDGSSSDTSTTEPICGDGIVEGSEPCDDGGESATCNDDCTPVVCGDGLLNVTAGESCDDGGESVTCDDDCTPATCGDGGLNEVAGEQCDDAGETATCNASCTLASCGDGIFNASAGEACDEAGRTAACDVDCTLVECGDGLVSVMVGEACDDAGESATCNSDCSLASCGDGITNVSAGEACDDLDESAACDSDCSLASCGDGTTNVSAGEACDDEGTSAACDDDCTAAICGDLLANAVAGESCDGLDLAGSTCQSAGYYGGVLACAPGCTLHTAGCYDLPGTPVLALGFSQVKEFDFTWAPTLGAEHYELLESVAPGEPFVQLGGDILGTSLTVAMPLHRRHAASYVLRACNGLGCTDSATVNVMGSLAQAVGYFKASNNGTSDVFGLGDGVALSDDGNTLAVAAQWEDSSSPGIGGNQADNGAPQAGAVYVFTRNPMNVWSQQAYIKAASPDSEDWFGHGLALSSDGSTLAVSANREDSSAAGIDGDQADDSLAQAGAAYVFTRSLAGVWSQQAYIKASNPGGNDYFGESLALSGDGNTLAVGSQSEASNATGIDGNQANESAPGSGAVYVFTRNPMNVWTQQAYVKASNTATSDFFGTVVALSHDGDTLAVGSIGEDGNATGIDGNQANDTASFAGAVYVFARDPMDQWAQQAYVKAPNTDAGDYFGEALALSGSGDTLVVTASRESSSATGIDGDQSDDSIAWAGAVYVLERNAMEQWAHTTYLKASNTAAQDQFGQSLALSADGNVLAVGVVREDSNATGINGNQANDSSAGSGAVYVFVRSGSWSQQAYVKASNTGPSDAFGGGLDIDGTGDALAVGAGDEDSQATGIGGNQAGNLNSNSGAVYLY